jgi:hypothetical protein
MTRSGLGPTIYYTHKHNPTDVVRASRTAITKWTVKPWLPRGHVHMLVIGCSHHVSGVMLVSVVDRWSEPRSGHTKTMKSKRWFLWKMTHAWWVESNESYGYGFWCLLQILTRFQLYRGSNHSVISHELHTMHFKSLLKNRLVLRNVLKYYRFTVLTKHNLTFPAWIIEWSVLQYHVYKLLKISAKDMDESHFNFI